MVLAHAPTEEQKKLLEKARKIAKTNSYVKSALEYPRKQKLQQNQKRIRRIAEAMNSIAKVYKEQPSPIVLSTPTPDTIHDTIPLKLPPHKHTFLRKSDLEKIREQKQMIERLQENQTTVKRKPGRPKKLTQIDQNNDQKHPDQKKNPKHNAEATTSISTSAERVERTDDNANANNVSFGDSDSISAAPDIIEQNQKVSNCTSGDTSDEKVSNLTSDNREKVSNFAIKKVSHRGRRAKLTLATPVIYSTKQSKTTLNLVQIYSSELTKEQIGLVLDHREELNLTHAEETALSLLQDMETNPESRKQYWKIQETLARAKQQPTPVKTDSTTLLDKRLEAAEEAIFGEIIEKPIDNESGN